MQERCNRCYAELAAGANYCARCGALVAGESSEHAHDALLGRVLLGRYRVQRLLGEGGMGRVYLAEQAMGHATRPVAIKALRKELISDPKGSGRFMRESEIVIRLAHPNTIQFYDFGQLDDGTPLIVMEYIEGRTLAAVLGDGPLPHERTRTLLAQICGSVAEAHAHGFVHRDLKPHNVLLTARAGQSDFVKVLDFGIALQQGEPGQEATRLTTQGTLIGTPPYMSPEQFQGQPIDARCDVYSLGVMAYEMLSGELPFDAKTPWQWAVAHVDQTPKPLAQHPAARDLPEHSSAAVMRALSKDPAQRPSNAAAFLREYLGPEASARDPIVLSLAPPSPAQAMLDDAQGDAALPMAPTVRSIVPELERGAAPHAAQPPSMRARWLRVAAALALFALLALVGIVRQRTSMPDAARVADAQLAKADTLDPAASKRARAAHRHGADSRTSESEISPAQADDELSALAARADRLRASADEPESLATTGAAGPIRDELAGARAAIEAGDLGAAAALLAAAEHRPGVDLAALGALTAQLSEAVDRGAQQLLVARNCAALSSLLEGLRSASFPVSAGSAPGSLPA